jgi:hypothetical protein
VSARRKKAPPKIGPGRPPLARGEETVALTVRLSETQVARLDAYAQKVGAKGRADALRRMAGLF